MDILDQMRTFVAVVDASSFTAAGKRLGRSKALVSKHIGELESRLGARLLNRTTRQVSLTEIGRAYCDRARGLLAELEALEDAVRSQTGVTRGLLKLTAPQSLGDTGLMSMIAAFRAAHPKVELDIMLTDRMVDLVAEGFDVALRISSLQDSSLIVRRLCTTRLLLCASPHYLENFGAPSDVRALSQHRLVVDTVAGSRDMLRLTTGAGPEKDRAATVAARATIAVNGAVAVRELLLAGTGIGLCPEFAVAGDLRDGRLVSLIEDSVDRPLDVQLIYPHRLHLSGKVRAFIDFAVQWYQPQPPWLREA